MVERQQARRAYEDFLHRKQDPALLENAGGNEFRARIFPIAPKANKEIIISYSQQLARRDQRYRLHLKGLPTIDTLEITALIGERKTGPATSSLGGVAVSHKTVRVHKQGWAPDRDFEVEPESKIAGLRHGNLALMRVAPQLLNKRDHPAFTEADEQPIALHRQAQDEGLLAKDFVNNTFGTDAVDSVFTRRGL